MPYYSKNTYITSMTWIEENNKNKIVNEVLKIKNKFNKF